MILIADGLHNFIGGLAIGGSFLINIRAGMITAIIEAVHEVPQELGDFGILLYGGWKKPKALLANFLSALAIIPGGILSLYSSESFNTEILLPFAGGNFLYIAASDLIPEIKGSQYLMKNLLLFTAFAGGVLFILMLKMLE
jgi:zinc and cadmium transporter